MDSLIEESALAYIISQRQYVLLWEIYGIMEGILMGSNEMRYGITKYIN